MPVYTDDFQTIPVGTLGILPLPGCEELASKIDSYLVKWRERRDSEHKDTIAFHGYQRETYLIKASFPRFGTGEAKCQLKDSVRGYDVFILCDCFNYGITHEIYGHKIPYSPDEHFANLKRAIAAMTGKARRITVIMPMLYEGRQHKRSTRESLDCALMLQELYNLYGIDNFITFDAHDPRVVNAIPLKGFENVYTTYQMIKALVNSTPELKIDKEHLVIISPDEGGMNRGVYYSSMLGLDLGMFYKRRDYSRVVKGRNPIIAHEFLGSSIENKDVVVVDDMISSGESMIEVARKLKSMGARNIYVCCAFGLFCNGLKIFDDAYEEGAISKVFTTNLIYRSPELLEREWFVEVDLSKYISLLIDALNHDMSISSLLNHAQRIKPFLESKGFNIEIKSE
ncbi:MAG: ribose-phosphate pyrophosphokinase [Oscillospiraceae bacterium]|nr:ribose-phosphate pyrophosphokinase [Oscillospiraceae bacterium]